MKAFTEALQHEWRNAPGNRISAHLFITASSSRGYRKGPHREAGGGMGTPDRRRFSWIEGHRR